MGQHTDRWWTGRGKSIDEAVHAAHLARLEDEDPPSWEREYSFDYSLELKVSILTDGNLEFEAILRKD